MNKLIKRIKCPWCSHSLSEVLCQISYEDEILGNFLREFYGRVGRYDAKSLEGGIFEVRKCRECRFVFQADIPSPDFMHEIYCSWIDSERCFETFERIKSIEYYEARFNGIIDVCRFLRKPLHTIKVLDYSLGWSQWAKLALAVGLEVFGTEFTPEKRRFASRLGVQVLDESELGEEFFDIVNVSQVLEHVPEPDALLASLCRTVRRGGVIIIGVPYGQDIDERLASPNWGADKYSSVSLMPVHPLEHINCFAEHHLVERLECLGFEIVDFETASWIRNAVFRLRRRAGELYRTLLGRKRPPLTIDVVARRMFK